MKHCPATLRAPAKINLHLDILARRDDGYHELSTLFLPVPGLSDTLVVEPMESGGLRLRCPDRPELETEDNLLHKGWAAFGRATGFRPDLRLTLTKRIPMGAGLGGGSTDCAALLVWLNANAGPRALPEQDLMRLAAKLGADVPFFLMAGPARATGIGDQLTPADVSLKGMHLVLACPDVHVSSAWAYRAWDEANPANPAQSLTTQSSHTNNPSPVIPVVVRNGFEHVVFAAHPRLRGIKEFLIISGAAAAAMSGSGSSIFGVFRNTDQAEKAARALREQGIPVHVEAM